MAKQVNPELQAYIEANILPLYDAFDMAHQQDHARDVIRQSLNLAERLDVDVNMVYAIGAYHDTGLCEGREHHHEASARIIKNDNNLRKWFTEEQIAVMAEAAEDHRASLSKSRGADGGIGSTNSTARHEPRSIYGRIVADADRHIDPITIIRRTIQFGLDHYPRMQPEAPSAPEALAEGHFKRMINHLHEKYGRNGYLRLWFEDSDNARQLEKLRSMMDDEDMLRELFNRFYNQFDYSI